MVFSTTLLVLLWCILANGKERSNLSPNVFITCDDQNQVQFSSIEGLKERTWFSFDVREVLSVKAFSKFDIETVQGSYRVKSSEPSFETTKMMVTSCSVVDDVALLTGRCSGAVVGNQRKNEIQNLSLSFDYNMTFKVSDSTSPLSHVDGIDFSVELTPSDSISRSYSFQQSAVYARIQWNSDATQDYFGFGEQYSHINMKGKQVPILVSEQGVGRGLEPISFALGLQSGNEFTTYAPLPIYIATATSNENSTTDAHAFMLRNTEYCVFDMTLDNITTVDILRPNFGNGKSEPIVGTLFRSSRSRPLDLLHGITEYTGRMRSLPSWILRGAVIGLEGGTDAVTEILNTLRYHDVAISAAWLQDWSGVNVDNFGERVEWNWQLDSNRYPRWNELAQDVRLMTYINPYLANNMYGRQGRNLFQEASELGYLIRNSSGHPYILASGTANFTFGTIDFTNPDAASWYSNVIRCNMLGLRESCTANTTEPNVTGSFGWMADFGEYVPFDAVLHDGASPSTIHNRFPELWAKVNRDAVGDNNDIVFFMRSASLKSPGLARLFWAGDQLVSWDDHDGLKTVMRAHMSAGMSGMTLSHSDCGGYTMINVTKKLPLFTKTNVTIEVSLRYLRTKHLLMRWMELSAFADTILRTHLGNLPSDSWQVYSDNETMIHFAKFTRVHSALANYRERLMKDAENYGYPLVRHSYLVYPDDLLTRGLRDQFFLGNELLVAPVVDEKADHVIVYLPENGTRWTHVWSEAIYRGGQFVNVSAGLGEPAVFHRTLSIEGIELAHSIRRAASM